jgi:hypothetical protein
MVEWPPEGAVDLGHETFYTKVFRGDVWIGIHEWHKEGDEYSAGFVAFTGRTRPDWWRSDSPTWEVLNEDPLTLSPSLLCGACKHHGWIREGKWVPA